jgi:hypothetical protein
MDSVFINNGKVILLKKDYADNNSDVNITKRSWFISKELKKNKNVEEVVNVSYNIKEIDNKN